VVPANATQAERCSLWSSASLYRRFFFLVSSNGGCLLDCLVVFGDGPSDVDSTSLNSWRKEST